MHPIENFMDKIWIFCCSCCGQINFCLYNESSINLQKLDDGSWIIDKVQLPLKVFAQSSKSIIIQKEKEYEVRNLLSCQKCNVFIAYESQDPNIIYLLSHNVLVR